MKHQRLSTEELIQQNREHYNASIYAQQIKEMELTIILKDKQMKCLNAQINSLKEESSVKISLLERQIIDLKKEIGENRASIVRERRLENQKYQKLLANYRKEQQLKSKQIEEQNNIRFQALIKQHQQQMQRAQKKYEQLMQLQKKELLAFMNINEDKNNNTNLLISRLQEEKAHLSKLKREAEQKCEYFRQSMEKLKAEFKLVIEQKDQELNIKNGQIQGLKLQKKLMSEQLDIIKEKQFSSQSFSRQAYQELNQQFNRLSQQNMQLKREIQDKNDQILKYHQQTNQQELQKVPINPVYQCSHLSLINQMTKNLQLKDKEIQKLKTVVQQWSLLIGFDKPLSQRLSQLTQKSQNVKSLNSSLSENLKQRVKSMKAHKN